MAAVAVRFMSQKTERLAKLTETLAGLWVFVSYLLLGLVPMAVKVWT